MLLQFLIPQYKEDDRILSNFLNSLMMQQGVNLNQVEVLIMNDGTDVKLTKEFLQSYPLQIKYYQSLHVGVSGIRQKLLDLATADYVMFCDADDMFCSLTALNTIFMTMQQQPFDILVSAFYQETILNNQFVYITKGLKDKDGVDGVFVHGKIYRRQFLLDNNIKWNPKLTLNEDSYFNTLALMLTKNIRYSEHPFYIWKHNVNSVTRSDPHWSLHNYSSLILSNSELLEQFEERKLYDKMSQYTAELLYNVYFTTNNGLWIEEENEEYRNIILRDLKSYLKKYKHYFDLLSKNIKDSVYVKQRALKSGGKEVGITFKDWMQEIAEYEE